MANKAADKKPNFFVRFFKSVIRFFKDSKGEMKKVVWPTRKQVTNNFLVVCVFVAVAALLIFSLDFVFNWIFTLVLELSAPAV